MGGAGFDDLVEQADWICSCKTWRDDGNTHCQHSRHNAATVRSNWNSNKVLTSGDASRAWPNQERLILQFYH